MSLRTLNEEVHRPEHPNVPGSDETIKSPVHDPVLLPKPEPTVPAPAVPLGEAWGGKEDRTIPVAAELGNLRPTLLDRIPKKTIVIFGFLALVAIIVGVLFKAGGWLFLPENIKISMSGPRDVQSNKEVEYTIQYENNNWIDLENAELIVKYPEMFRLTPTSGMEINGSQAVVKVGTVKRSSVNSLMIKGVFRAFQDQVAVLSIVLRATPSGVATQNDTEYSYTVAVQSSSIILELSAPSQVGDLQSVDYTVNYRNESPETVENFEVQMVYPEGFTFLESTPGTMKDNSLWSIGTLKSGEGGQIVIQGRMEGIQGDIKRARAIIGVPQGNGELLSYAEVERQTKIAASPLVISQNISKKTVVSPGEGLGYTINFKNEGDIGLRDLIVTVNLDPKYFDIYHVDTNGTGSYNLSKQQVIFRASGQRSLALLEPGQSGIISFSVPVRSDLASYRQPNIEIESIARIDSPDVPTPVGANKIIASNRISFKVRTDLKAKLTAYHFDQYNNTGPIPPVVGQETTYTISLDLTSTINSIDETRVIFALPGQVRYLKTHRVTQGTAVYNDRTGEVLWNAGTVSPGETHSAVLVFEIGITPDPSQIGHEASLLRGININGKDAWTDEALSKTEDGKSTNLPEDIQLRSILDGEEVHSF